VLPTSIVELHKDFNVDYFVELLNDEMWYPNAWKKQLEIAQESILKFYKEDVIKGLNEKLEQGLISYDYFMSSMKSIDNVQLLENSTELSKQEILDSINEEKARINLNRFEKLNNILKLVQGDFLIIGATTGAGKSGLMINLMADLMNTYQCIYFNMEMSKSTIYKRLVSVNANIKVSAVEKPQTEYQAGIINQALEKIEDARMIIEHKASDMTAIKSTIAKMKDKERHTVVFIDHLGLVKIDGAKSLYEQATEVAKELRQICLEYDCTIISASQLNRSAYDNNAKISLSMLKDSGELENSASKVLLLYKDKDSKKEDIMQNMIFDIAKNRDGYTGIIEAVYDKEKQIFKERGY
jgi:replicative DNA helicase